MIIFDKKQLSIPCEPARDIEEGLSIAALLRNEVLKHPEAIGLAANQIGINKRVFIIYSKSFVDARPMWLNFINPRIIKAENKVIVKFEGCLSFPDEEVMTERYNNITVYNDVFVGDCDFEGMEAICIQHELDHLNGLTMHDRRYDPKT